MVEARRCRRLEQDQTRAIRKRKSDGRTLSHHRHRTRCRHTTHLRLTVAPIHRSPAMSRLCTVNQPRRHTAVLSTTVGHLPPAPACDDAHDISPS